MEKLQKNSKVKILDSRPLWLDKIGQVLSTNFDPNDLDQEIKIKVELGNEKSVIQTFPIRDLELLIEEDYINEKINLTEFLAKKDEDIIKPYLISSDFDGEKESWYFANKIAVAENIEESEIISIAKKLNYPVYQIKTYNKKIRIIASKKITAEDIENEYARFLLGFKSIERI